MRLFYLFYSAFIVAFSAMVFWLFSVVAKAADDLPYQNLRATTVHIAIGSGFILEAPSGNKYLTTNWHVCNSGSWNEKMRANFESGKLVEGKISKKNPLSDLCSIKLSKDIRGLKIAGALTLGEKIYTRGYPLGVLSETSGNYVGRMRWRYMYPIESVGACFEGSRAEYDGMGHIVGCNVAYTDNVTSVYSRPGSSGSPVVNAQGELVGVISSWDGNRDAGGMVGLEEIKEFFSDL